MYANIVVLCVCFCWLTCAKCKLSGWDEIESLINSFFSSFPFHDQNRESVYPKRNIPGNAIKRLALANLVDRLSF